MTARCLGRCKKLATNTLANLKQHRQSDGAVAGENY
jgi:hypothetical protein